MSGQTKEERRKRSAKVLAAGSALTGGAALANYGLDRGMERGPGKLVDATLHGKLKPVHAAYGAGKMGVFATRMTGIPLMAAGAYGIARPKQNVRDFNVKRDVVKPVTNHLTLRQDAAAARARQMMEKRDSSADLTVREQKRLIAHKKSGKRLSEIGGTLGLTALAMRTPELAGIATRRIKAAGANKTLVNFAAKEPTATKISNTVGIGAIGTGAMGSFNYAAQQNLEAKQQRAMNRQRRETTAALSAIGKAGFVGKPGFTRTIKTRRGRLERLDRNAPIGFRPAATFAVDSKGTVKVVGRHRMDYSNYGVGADVTSPAVQVSGKYNALVDNGMVKNPNVRKSDDFIRTYGRNISPSAEQGYNELKGLRNREAGMAGANALLGGVVGADAVRRARTKGSSKLGTAVMGTWAGVQGLQTAYNATNAKRLQGRMNKIKAKGMQRAAEGKLGPNRVEKRAPERHEVEAGGIATVGGGALLVGAGNKKIMEHVANRNIATAERKHAKTLASIGTPRSGEKAKRAAIDAANKEKKDTVARAIREAGGTKTKLLRVAGLTGGAGLLYGAARHAVDKADKGDVDAAAAGAVLGGGAYQGLGYAGKIVDRKLDAAAARNPKSQAAIRAHRAKVMPGRGTPSSKQWLNFHRTYPKDVPGWQWKRLRSYTHGGAIGNTMTLGAAAAGAAGAVKIKRDREVGKSLISAAKDSHSVLHGALVPIATAGGIGGGTFLAAAGAQKAKRKKTVRKAEMTPAERKAAKQAAWEAKQAAQNSPEAQARRAQAQASGAAEQRRAAQQAPKPKAASPGGPPPPAPQKRAFIQPAQVSTMATHVGITGGGLAALKHRHEQRKRGEKPKGGYAADAAIGAATGWSAQDLGMVAGGFATKRATQAYRDHKMKDPAVRRTVNREWKSFQEREGFKQFGEKHPSDKPGLDMRTTRDQVRVGSRYPTKIPGGRVMRALAWKNHPAVTTPLAVGAAAAGGALAVRHARKQEVGKDVAGPLPGSHSMARGILTPIAVTGAIGGGTYLALVGAKKAKRKVKKSFPVDSKGKSMPAASLSSLSGEERGRLKTKLDNSKRFRTENAKKYRGGMPLPDRGSPARRTGTREGAAAAHRAARIEAKHTEAIAENTRRNAMPKSAPAKRAFTNPTQLGMWGSGTALTGGGALALHGRNKARARGEKPKGGVAADAAIGATVGWNAQNVANSAGGWALKRGTQAYREHKMKDPKVRATANREWSAFQRREGFKQFGEKHSSDRPGLDMRTPEAQVNVGRRYPTKIPGGRAMRALAWQNHPSVAIPMGVAGTAAGAAIAVRNARKHEVDKALLTVPRINYARRIGAGLTTRRPRTSGIRRSPSGKISTFRGSVR